MEETWLMTADVSRELDLTPSGVRFLVLSGRLRVGGKTAGGVRLFRKGDVQKLRELRQQAETTHRRYLCSARQ